MITNLAKLRQQFHIQVGVIQFPYPGIEFQEEIRGTKIAQVHTAISIANKIFIVSKLYINVFGYVSVYTASGIEVIGGIGLECFPKSSTGNLLMFSQKFP